MTIDFDTANINSYEFLVQQLREAYKTKARVQKSQRYRVGQGGAARESERVAFDQICADIATLELKVSRHPDNPANRGARRIRYLRPAG